MNIFVKILIIFFLFYSALFNLHAQSQVKESKGIQLFKQFKYKEAIPILEKEVKLALDESVVLSLAISYQETGMIDESIKMLLKIVDTAKNSSIVYYNLGNSYLLKGNFPLALISFDSAISLNENFASAYLQRANLKTNTKDYQAAVTDYKKYLSINSDSKKRDSVEKMILALTEAIEIQKREEADLIAKKAAELAARQALIDQLKNSLKDASDNTQSLSSGADKTKAYDDTPTLDE